MSNSKILIADDNIQNCELLEAYLSDEPYDITMAYDGQETLIWCIPSHRIRSNIMMPKLSGYEVCQRLLERPGGRTFPFRR